MENTEEGWIGDGEQRIKIGHFGAELWYDCKKQDLDLKRNTTKAYYIQREE